MSSQYRLFSATTTRAVGVGRVNRPSAMNDSSLNLRLQAGLAHQQAGQLDQAIDCYLEVLHADPASTPPTTRSGWPTGTVASASAGWRICKPR